MQAVSTVPEPKVISMITEHKSNEANNQKREIGYDVKCIRNTWKLTANILERINKSPSSKIVYSRVELKIFI